ncbi:hypothetical protein HCN44_007004 [Aphidius gifuensis]|uniref:DNA polymerase delta small subunit n=1 Tax=Aphidius gifuensis TaxID=684658 RepID=A0A835CU05_APHGI|nr:hypothetical protein HCN44_007004 [Aphidius gifuensis]
MSLTNVTENIVQERKCIEFEDFKRFKLSKDKKYDKQYSKIYNARLKALRDVLTKNALSKWGDYKILTIKNLAELVDHHESSIIIGTIYKHQLLKPSILKEYADEAQVKSQPASKFFSTEKDNLYIEDEVQRVMLSGGHVHPMEIVTGVVCAVLGYQLDDGTFWVEDYCLPGICPKKISTIDIKSPVSTSSSSSLFSDKYSSKKLLLLSGLDLYNTPDSMQFELLTEWITGIAGNDDSQENSGSICQVIFAGNSMRGTIETFEHTGFSGPKNKYTAAAKDTILAANRFDDIVNEIVQACCVLVMPGECDPTNYSLPQQPIHPAILPKSSKYKTLNVTTNPWIGKIDDKIVAGSSGQIIRDIMKVSSLFNLSPLEWLEKTLIWRNEGQNIRLISIPKFSETQQAVIVDLETLETSTITFGSCWKGNNDYDDIDDDNRDDDKSDDDDDDDDPNKTDKFNLYSNKSMNYGIDSDNDDLM